MRQHNMLTIVREDMDHISHIAERLHVVAEIVQEENPALANELYEYETWLGQLVYQVIDATKVEFEL